MWKILTFGLVLLALLAVGLLIRGRFPYWFRILHRLDLFVGSIFGIQETISSWLGKQLVHFRAWYAYWICRFLNLFDKRHCEKSIDYSAASPLKAGMVAVGIIASIVTFVALWRWWWAW